MIKPGKAAFKPRFNKRINITIPPELLRHLDANTKRYHISRSALIRWALHEWLERQAPPPNVMKKPAAENQRAFKEFIKPNMSPAELLAVLEDYEAGNLR